MHIQYLLLRGSVDDVMWRVCNAKLQSVGTVLDGQEDTLQVGGHYTSCCFDGLLTIHV